MLASADPWGGGGRSHSTLTNATDSQLCSLSLPAGCWPHGRWPGPGGSCGTLQKPVVWTLSTVPWRTAPWLQVRHMLVAGRWAWRGAVMHAPVSLPQSWPSWPQAASSLSTTRAWASCILASPGETCSSWASAREEGRAGARVCHMGWGHLSPIPTATAAPTARPLFQAGWRGHSSQLSAQPGPA